MERFIGGKQLCRDFFFEHGKPVLDARFPGMAYSAGLLGYGSDVLGYDDAVSTDHMWGPRFYLFLPPDGMILKKAVMAAFSESFPYLYKGYSVHFSAPDPSDNGIRHAETITSGKVSPLIFINTVNGFMEDYLGLSETENIPPAQWLAFSEHRLLALTVADIYHDSLGLGEKLSPLRFYPREIKLYLIASQWGLIAEEQAFVKRCGSVGDDLGSRLICARIAERLMRLCFLYREKYAAYSKWFGTAFERLDVSGEIKVSIKAALSAGKISEREDSLVTAQHLVALMHNESGLTKSVDTNIRPYFGRDIKVIRAEKIAEAVNEELRGTFFEGLPLIGAMSQIANFTCLWDDPSQRQRTLKIYQ